MEVIVVGGGASGMVAALSAASNPENRVTVIERQARVGRKLLATGNGRCNLSNETTSVGAYHGANPDFVLPALTRFPVSETRAFFLSLGLVTVREPDGKIYPLSDQANSVVDTLRFALSERAVRQLCGVEVKAVRRKNFGFLVETSEESLFADQLIIAAGGAAGEKLGGTRAGYALLAALGHSCTALYPALTQIKTDPALVRALKGIRADARVTLKCDGRVIVVEEGELQFTEFGVSGPVAFSLSRAMAGLSGTLHLVIDLVRPLPREALFPFLLEKRASVRYLQSDDFLTGILHNRLGRSILKAAGVPGEMPASELSDAQLQKICDTAKGFCLPVRGVMGMANAQITAGGVPTSEFDSRTLESRLCKSLFACGEVLDIDGDCGGFNLQWAWSSGRLAGLLGRKEGAQ